MSIENKNKKSSEEKLKSFIAQKTSENEALKKLLDELNKEVDTTSNNSTKKEEKRK